LIQYFFVTKDAGTLDEHPRKNSKVIRRIVLCEI
jgi:hypothetical protein